MKYYLLFQLFGISIICLCLVACNSHQQKTITLQPMQASGEFLFEGPNTLQGNFILDTEELAESANISAAEIKEVYVNAVTLNIGDDESKNIESVLVQLVSDQLPLQSIGTLTGVNAGSNQLSANQELNIQNYVSDPSSSIIVDANLTQDMDELSVSLVLDLLVKY